MLTVTYIPIIDKSYAARLTEQARQVDPRAQVQGVDPGPQNAIEWALPAVIAFVVGGIATAILEEAGRDIYQGFKKLVSDAYEEASRTPCAWQSGRREPTLDLPAGKDGDGHRQSPPTRSRLSPPLKVRLSVEGLEGGFDFVFPDDLTPEQFADAYDAMTPTVRAIVDYCTFLFAQLRSKQQRPELYQGTMPDSMWESRLDYEIREARMLMHCAFVFDSEARIWVRVR